jgi:hypothetical protein
MRETGGYLHVKTTHGVREVHISPCQEDRSLSFPGSRKQLKPAHSKPARIWRDCGGHPSQKASKKIENAGKWRSPSDGTHDIGSPCYRAFHTIVLVIEVRIEYTTADCSDLNASSTWIERLLAVTCFCNVLPHRPRSALSNTKFDNCYVTPGNLLRTSPSLPRMTGHFQTGKLSSPELPAT